MTGVKTMQKNILEYLEHTAARLPGKDAFCSEKESLTFGQVYDQARAIGSALSERGIYKEAVLIYMDKSPSTVMAFLGAVYGGCFYVPLDEEMPFRRIQLIMESTKARILICDAHTMEKVEQLNFSGEVVLCSEMIKTPIDESALARIRRDQLDTDPIYVLFTSGSTGMPKGVVGHHRGIIDYIDQLSDVMGFDEKSVFGNQTPLYFDASMKELYGTFKCGSTTWIIPKQLFMFPIDLVKYLNEKKINTVCWVVSALTMISAFDAFDEVIPEYLHTIGFGGEVFPVSQFNIWKKILPDAKFVNLYGPTEASGVCTYYFADRLYEDGEVIPLGRPFDNTGIFLLTEDGRLAEDGEIGEMCIRGTGVTHGYYNDPERTKEVFVQNPLQTSYNEIVYKTGDLAKTDPDGNLVFVSRKDFQIKHMGHRIELGEIDANADLVEGVSTCCSIYSKDDGKIVMFYTGDIEKRKLTKALKEKLPRYMIPNVLVPMEELPHTATGKMDRVAMSEYYKKQKETGR